MINHKNVLSPKGISCTKQYFLLFFFVITSIPSTFAIQTEIVANPFGDNAYFQTIFQILTSVLLPIFIKETFNKKLSKNPFLLLIYFILIIIDWILTDRFTQLCQDAFGDPFFRLYYKWLLPLFIFYIIESTFLMGFYVAKYLNALATAYHFSVSLAFLMMAIDKEYVDRYLGNIIKWFIIGLFSIIVFLNIISNLIMHIDDKFITMFVEIKKITKEIRKKIYCCCFKDDNDNNNGDNDNSDEEEHQHINYNVHCPICLSHNYVHVHLDHGFKLKKRKNKERNDNSEDEDNDLETDYEVEEEKDKNNLGINYKVESENNKDKECPIHLFDKDCPICLSHKFIHFHAKQVEDNEKKAKEKNTIFTEYNITIDRKKNLRIRKKCYLKINEKVNIFYYLLNIFCAISFAMIAGPTALWGQFYLTVNTTEYSMYQTGLNSTHSILENILYPTMKKKKPVDIEANNKKSDE